MCLPWVPVWISWWMVIDGLIFSVHQLQEKCGKKQKPPYLNLIDPTKVFDLVSRDSLFQILSKIGCPPRLHSMIVSFYENMKGNTSDAFYICCRVKQGYVLAQSSLDLLFPTSETCLSIISRGPLLPHQVRWKTLQCHLPQSQTKVWDLHMWYLDCQWCCSCHTHWKIPSIWWIFIPDLQRLWPGHQSKGD